MAFTFFDLFKKRLRSGTSRSAGNGRSGTSRSEASPPLRLIALNRHPLATLPPTWSSHKLTFTHADSPVAVPSLVPSIAALVTIVADQTTIVRRQVHQEPSQLLSPQRWHQCGGRKEADRCAKSFFQQKNDSAQRRRLADAPEGRALALEQHAQRGASCSAAWFSSVRAPPGATRTSSGSSRRGRCDGPGARVSGVSP